MILPPRQKLVREFTRIRHDNLDGGATVSSKIVFNGLTRQESQ